MVSVRVLSSLASVLLVLLIVYSALMVYNLGLKVFYPLSTKEESMDGTKRGGLQPGTQVLYTMKANESSTITDGFRTHKEQGWSSPKPEAERASKIHTLRATSSVSSHPTCEVIHVAVLSVRSRGARETALLIKSMLIHRSTTIHFHFVVDDIAHVILKELFRTWEIVGVQYSFYMVTNTQPLDGSEGLKILQLPYILPATVHKVIVLNASRILNSDPRELWCLFDRFGSGQHIGSRIMGGDYKVRLGVMLFDLAGLRNLLWLQLCAEARAVFSKSPAYRGKLLLQAVLDGLLQRQPELFFRLPCQWSYELSDSQSSCLAISRSGVKVVDYDINHLPHHDWQVYLWTVDYNGNQLRDFQLERRAPAAPTHFDILNKHLVELADHYSNSFCSDYTKEFVAVFRTHLFYMDFQYEPSSTGGFDLDVTLVSQISISRISSLERLCGVWPGPISVAVYLKDSDVRHFETYVLHSAVFSKRRNIAFHLVYQEGSQYPTNHLRNVAGMGVKTSHAFLLDVDFMPVEDVHSRIMRALRKSKDYPRNTVFVVPAFETEITDRFIPVPKTKEEMALLWEAGIYVLFRVSVFPEGHRASNYTVWRNATEPYQIYWEYGYEPYIVIPTKGIPHYDERFLGYGGDKLSHIMELAAKGYYFMGLPDVFVVHLPHGVSFDSIRFRSSDPMRRCLMVLLEDFGMELVAKYGDATLNGWKPIFVPQKITKA